MAQLPYLRKLAAQSTYPCHFRVMKSWVPVNDGDVRNMDEYPGHRANRLAPAVTGYAEVPSSERATVALERIAASLERIEGLVEGRRAPKPRAPRRQKTKVGNRRVMAASFIEVLLRENAYMAWQDIVERGREFRHAKSTLELARSEVAVCEVVNGRWFWRLKKQEGMGNGTADRLR